ncbi:NEDD8 ultimate buster 1 isoform X2 [Galleria mellonella]|uniref:NEDD8 ultimate buster 1 isoform X2 n=1 Tax=Galleria mellonella TaxID=7137 RepID=A0ABM3ME33_GALME|nr:NEDD8 ultimate buster 1 isoform X2 [Galleria mellonella]
METNLQHEDLLIKLRAKLNEDKIKLWEPPYIQPDNGISQSLQELAKKYSTALSIDLDTILQGLHELQLHSVDRSKANEEYKETGFATLRIKATIPGERPKIMKVQKKLYVMGSDLITAVAEEIGMAQIRLKLIFNGKVIKPTSSLEEQGIKNGVQIMALIMSKTPDEVKKEDEMYLEMKSTREDAALLSKYADEDYMKLEDQSGKAIELPAGERRALLVGLALHERGRAAARRQDYSRALVLLLDADRQLSECSSSILKSVDNYAVLQLDIAWCYLCLQSLSSATDAAARLARAEASLLRIYGEQHQTVAELKGNLATERVLLMRLYLLQGIVAYHQNKRAEARQLLDKAESELNLLRVDETSVCALVELGWSRAQARGGLRAAGGDRDRAHLLLAARRDARRDLRRRASDDRRRAREERKRGLCADGSAVSPQLVRGLQAMGYTRRRATLALRAANNRAAEAVRLIQEQPELLADSEDSSDDTETTSSDVSLVEPDNKLIAELEAMGYESEEAKAALRVTNNSLDEAANLLVASGGHIVDGAANPTDPSTSAATSSKKKPNKHKKSKRKEECEMALERLSSAIRTEEDDHLDTTLIEEEEFLAQYKSLL